MPDEPTILEPTEIELERSLDQAVRKLRNLVEVLRYNANPDPFYRDALLQTILRSRRALVEAGEWSGDIEDKITEQTRHVIQLGIDRDDELEKTIAQRDVLRKSLKETRERCDDLLDKRDNLYSEVGHLEDELKAAQAEIRRYREVKGRWDKDQFWLNVAQDIAAERDKAREKAQKLSEALQAVWHEAAATGDAEGNLLRIANMCTAALNELGDNLT